MLIKVIDLIDYWWSKCLILLQAITPVLPYPQVSIGSKEAISFNFARLLLHAFDANLAIKITDRKEEECYQIDNKPVS